MVCQVNHPIKLRVDADSICGDPKSIQEALEQALQRALEHSLRVTANQSKLGAAYGTNPILIAWNGPGVPGISTDDRTKAETWIKDLIAKQVRAKGLPAPGTLVAQRDPFAKPSAGQLSAGAAQPPAKKPLDFDRVLRNLLSDDKDTRGFAAIDLWFHVADGEPEAIFLALMGLRADGSYPTEGLLNALKQLARDHPKLFRQQINDILSLFQKQAARITREPDTLFIQGLNRQDLTKFAQVLGGINLAAQSIPLVRNVVNEYSQKDRSVPRLLALVQALIDARLRLETYLRHERKETFDDLLVKAFGNYKEDHVEDTDPGILSRLNQGTLLLPRVSGVLIGMSGNASVDQLAHDLEVDLLENIRWIVHTLEQIQRIDGLLALYFEIYKKGAEQLEEVEALREARRVFLFQVTGRWLPQAGNIAGMIKKADDIYATWYLTAADRKVAKLLSETNKVAEYIGKISLVPDSPLHDGFTKSFTDTVNRLGEVQNALHQLKNKTRDFSYLTEVSQIEMRVPMLGVRTSLLSLWGAAHKMLAAIDGAKNIGSSSLRKEWREKLGKVCAAVEKEYAKPDFTDFKWKLDSWHWDIESVQGDFQLKANELIFFTIVIAVVAVVVTAGAAAVFLPEGAGLITVTLFEASTFTAITTLGCWTLLDQPIEPGKVTKDFALNVATFGTFRVLGAGVQVGARLIAPQRALAQLVIIFTGEAVIATGVPALFELLQGHTLSEMNGYMIAGNLLLLAAVRSLTAKETLEKLKQLAAEQARIQELVAKMQQIDAEALAFKNEMEGIIKRGGPTEAEFRATQQKGVDLHQRARELVKAMQQELSDKILAQLKITREQLNKLAEILDDNLQLIRKATPPTGTSQKLLPSPDKVIELTEVGSGTYEYNPYNTNSQPDQLVPRLRRSGYEVQDTGGGVLRLKAPDGVQYLLLPGKPDVPPPALVKLVGSPRTNTYKGWKVLQQQMAVPPLEAKLTGLVATDSEGVRLILDGIGRHLNPNDTQALQHIFHFLEVGGSPRAVGIVLANSTSFGKLSTLRAMEVFGQTNASEARAIDFVAGLRSTTERAATNLIGISEFKGRAPLDIFLQIEEIAAHTDAGLDRLLSYVGSPNDNRKLAGLGSLRAAFNAIKKIPGSRLEFELEVVQANGLIREIDVRVKLPPGHPLKFLDIEVKEVQAIELLGQPKVLRQFAKDILRQVENPPPAPFHTFSRMPWVIREPAANASAVKDRVREILRQAFNSPTLKQGVPNQARRSALLDEFDKHIDDIILFE